jgi:hypothetical protein
MLEPIINCTRRANRTSRVGHALKSANSVQVLNRDPFPCTGAPVESALIPRNLQLAASVVSKVDKII